MEQGLGIIVACVSLFGTLALVIADLSADVDEPEMPVDAAVGAGAVEEEELRRAA